MKKWFASIQMQFTRQGKVEKSVNWGCDRRYDITKTYACQWNWIADKGSELPNPSSLDTSFIKLVKL